MSSSCTGSFGVVNVIVEPPSKSIPKLRPLIAIEPIERTIRTPAIVNHSRRRPTMSIFCHQGISRALAPMNRGLSNQLNRARIPSSARVPNTAVRIEMPVPSRSMNANPLTPAVATANSTRAAIAVTTLASTIVAKPFL